MVMKLSVHNLFHLVKYCSDDLKVMSVKSNVCKHNVVTYSTKHCTETLM